MMWDWSFTWYLAHLPLCCQATPWHARVRGWHYPCRPKAYPAMRLLLMNINDYIIIHIRFWNYSQNLKYVPKTKENHLWNKHFKWGNYMLPWKMIGTYSIVTYIQKVENNGYFCTELRGIRGALHTCLVPTPGWHLAHTNTNACSDGTITNTSNTSITIAMLVLLIIRILCITTTGNNSSTT